MLNDDYAGGWFGESWGAPVCAKQGHKATPVGQRCFDCKKKIAEGDQGLLIPYVAAPGKVGLDAWHHACFVRGLPKPRT